MDPAALLIVDENRLFREGLKHALSDKTFTIQHEVDSFVDALRLMRTAKVSFDLIVGNPGAADEIEYNAIDAIRLAFPNVKVVVLTDSATALHFELALKNGVVGFLSKQIAPTALRHSLELVLMGEPVFPITVTQRIQTSLPSSLSADGVKPSDEQMPLDLSNREKQILKCLVTGLPNKLIARELDIAEPTVKVHLRGLLRKLKARNRTQAAIWAIENAPRNAA
jgi:two-component system nitrate/nitrite response regulator NarL